MPLYVYCIVNRGPQPPVPVKGVEGAQVDRIVLDNACFVMSRLVSEPARSLPNIRRHGAVCDALLQDHAVVPMRFGTLVPNEEALSQHWQAHGTDYTDRLASVEGCIEIGLRAALPSQDGATARPFHGLHDALRLTARQATELKVDQSSSMVTAAYLVERRALAQLRHAVSQFRLPRAYRRLVLTGPWPPYHFAQLSGQGPGQPPGQATPRPS